MPDDAFALVTGSYGPAPDPLAKDTWQALLSLPTEVLLRTTDHRGTQIAQLHNLWRMWNGALPMAPRLAPFMFAAAWDAADDFEASIFIAMHGYYRQGLANLRSALEGVTIAAHFARKSDAKGLRRWLDGETEPKFGNARDILAPLLGTEITAVLVQLHRDLSSYIHTGPGGSNVTLWDGSNGPVWEPDSFTLFYRTYRDVMAMSLVMLAIGWPGYSIPQAAWGVFESPDGAWSSEARAAARQWGRAKS
jgi:hypothetical protein